MNEVEGIGSSDGNLLVVDVETVLGNPGADVEVVDSSPVVLIQLDLPHSRGHGCGS